MEDIFHEVLVVIEDSIEWLSAAALHYETFAARVNDAEKSRWGLIAAAYREKAGIHEQLARKMRGEDQLTETESAERLSLDERRSTSLGIAKHDS